MSPSSRSSRSAALNDRAPLGSRLDLREAWADLLHRRPRFAEALAIYGKTIEAWAAWAPSRPVGSAMTAEACRAFWEAGTPLSGELVRALCSEDVEDLVGEAMESLARLDPRLGPALQRLAGPGTRGP